ncbi:MAG: abortive infection family protein [Rhodocyclaceae bacterium]|nr:abortive infection family protein [Rhodocyclaceae bacterium]
MSTPIPQAVIAVCAEIMARRETHATLDSLFMYAGAPGEPPEGSKHAKALEWMRIINRTESVEPLRVLGSLIEAYMEDEPKSSFWNTSPVSENGDLPDRERLRAVLARSDLQYVKGGAITGALGTASKTLEDFIKEFNAPALEHEFTRALSNVEKSPREAVSAASNILESVCKVYIAENGLAMPAKQDLKPVWSVVRKDLGFDPGAVEDQDLQTILTGLLAIVDGIGALRTHASSAHGAGKIQYKLEPRHARLSIHAAHTITLFILESWRPKKAPQ